MLNTIHPQMLKEFRPNWHNTTRKHHYTLKAETQAEGETLQRLKGDAAAKNQNGFHICVLRRYFMPNDQLHHLQRENATEAA